MIVYDAVSWHYTNLVIGIDQSVRILYRDYLALIIRNGYRTAYHGRTMAPRTGVTITFALTLCVRTRVCFNSLT